MIIHPHLGIGEIILGSSRARIASLLGEPCERKLESFSGTTTMEYFMYDQSDLSLGFDSEDGDRLGVITTEDVSATYLDQPIIGMEINQFLSAFSSFMLEDDFEESGRDYADDNQGLSVWVIDDVVESMTIFPRFIDDKPCWPKQLGEQGVAPQSTTRSVV